MACYNLLAIQSEYAGVVKLADTLDLGSSASAWRFESSRPHQLLNHSHYFGNDFFLRLFRLIVFKNKICYSLFKGDYYENIDKSPHLTVPRKH